MLRSNRMNVPANKTAWLSSVLALLLLSAVIAAPIATAAPVKPNDPLRVKQTYLDQIHMPDAWLSVRSAVSAPIVVALVDTGVDLTHPDLQGKLITGSNLLEPKQPPQDDNGHGTNVAGIIAAAQDNDKGIAGIAQNVRIMPIKALESDGRGDEAKLSEGIRYGVDHGARIIVLSLGLYRYNQGLARTVQYAEERGVLLVAATGNEGNSVNYPAAYPTVVAVGGVDPYNRVEYRSNIGSEIDLVAPYDVFTTVKGGGYGAKNGTSMAAPQVAAAAALALNKYPWMKPYQLRSLLRQTAENLGAAGWDFYTGYGLLRADRVLLEPYREDPYEPSDQAKDAATIPVNRMFSAEFSGGSDTDWFKIDSPYDGTLNVTLELNDHSNATVVMYDGSLRQQAIYNAASGQTLQFPVKRGYSFVKLQAADTTRSTSVGYRLTTDLLVYQDPFEPNDKQYEAFVLPAQSQVIKGTFDHTGDSDWYMLHIEQSARLTIRLSNDTARMDPILMVQKKGEKGVTYDQGGNGADETTSLEVFPGDYYVRVSNQRNYTNAIMGEYMLSFNYTPKWLDPNEPNEKPYQAASLSPGTEYFGTFEHAEDVDWFQLDVTQDSLLELRVNSIPLNHTVTATIVDSSLKLIWTGDSAAEGSGDAQLLQQQHLTTGMYYIKLQSNWPFSNQPFRLQADLVPLLAGYKDIDGHWAESTIVEMSKRGIIEGYADYRFLPDGVITRAEAAAILSRAFRYTKENPLRFPDVPASHWAYSGIAKAALAGAVDGYPDGTFRPNASVTRMEMASMIAKSLGMIGKKRGAVPFSDIDEDHWGTGILKQLKADERIGGFPDGSFRPDWLATRAEFLTALQKILKP